MNWLLLPFVFLLALPSHLQGQNKPKDAVIIGYVDNPTALSLSVSYKRNDFTLEAGSFETVIDSATHFFGVRFQLQHPTIVYMKYKDKTMRFYLANGDTLRLRFNGIAPIETLSFDGLSNAAAHNAYLLQTCNKFSTWLSDAAVLEALESKTPTDYRKFLDGIYQKKKEFLDKYNASERDRFAPEFIDFATADVDYWWAYHLMLYYQKYGLNNPMADRKIPEPYFDFNLEIDNLSSKALHNEYYLRYVELWLKYERERRIDNFGPQPSSIAFTEEKNRVERYVKPKAETLKVLEEAFLPDKIVSYLSRDEEGMYLNQMTFEKFRYKDQKDSMLEDIFIRIRTPERKYGWVPYSMVNFSEKLITEQIRHPRLCFDVHSPTCGFDNILIGKVLYYMLTKDIVLMTQYEVMDVLRKRANDFQQLNREFPEYNEIVQRVVDWQHEDRLNSLTRLRVPTSCEAAVAEVNQRYETNQFRRIRVIPAILDTTNKQPQLPPLQQTPNAVAKVIIQTPSSNPTEPPTTVKKTETKPEPQVAMKDDVKIGTEPKITPNPPNVPPTQRSLVDMPSNSLGNRTSGNTNNSVNTSGSNNSAGNTIGNNGTSEGTGLKVNVSPSPDAVQVVSNNSSIIIDDRQKYMAANYGTSGYKPGVPVVFNGLTVNETAPDFTFTDIDGATHRLSDFKDKIIYIDFWATWCTLCKDPLIYAQSLVEDYKNKGVVFIFISIDREADRTKWTNMVKSNQWAGIHANDRGIVRLNFQVEAVPNFFLIGKDGRVARNSIMRTNGGLVAMLDELLSISSEDGK